MENYVILAGVHSLSTMISYRPWKEFIKLIELLQWLTVNREVMNIEGLVPLLICIAGP